MRDDIHRNAPLPPNWKRVVSASARDADWFTEGPRVLGDTMRGELVDIYAGNFPERLRRALGRQANLLPAMRDLDGLRSVCCPRNAAQEAVAGHAIQMAKAIGPGQVNVADAVRTGVQEVADRYFRATEEHCARNFPTQRRELMRRLHACRSTLDLSSMAPSTLEGPSARRSRRPALNVDDGLPLGSEGRPRG